MKSKVKKRCKQMLTGLLALSMLCGLLPQNTVNVSAATTAKTTVSSYGRLGTVDVGSKTKSGTWWKINVGSKTAFCLSLGKTCHTGNTYQVTDTHTWNQNTGGEKHGYYAKIIRFYVNDCNRAKKGFVLGQALIWAVSEGNTSEANLKNVIKQVKANTGYFPNKTVAELYKQIFQPTGAWEAKATMWEKTGATKGYQKLITVDADILQNPNYKTITDHTYYRQRITLHKQDEDGKGLGGIKFTLSADNLDDLYSFNVFDRNGDTASNAKTAGVYRISGGKLTTDYLRSGNTYYLKEIQAPTGFLLSDEVKELKIDASAKTDEFTPILFQANFADTSIKGRIAVKKKSYDPTKKEYYPENNTTFQVYLKSKGSYDNCADDERATIKTDADGYAVTGDLVYGTYVVHQVDSGDVDAYYVDDFEANVTENGKVYEFEKVNELFKAYFKIIKQDKNTEKTVLKPGTSYQIYQVVDGKEELVTQEYMEDGEKKTVDTFICDESGEVVTVDSLRSGTYHIYEVAAADGFVTADAITYQIKSVMASSVAENPTDTVASGSAVTVKPVSGSAVSGETGISYTSVVAMKQKDGTFADHTDDKIIMVDEQTHIQLLKLDKETGQALGGAKFVVTDSKGNKVMKFVTKDDAYDITGKLVVGETYTFTEVSAPSGYQLAKPVQLTIKDTGKVQTVTVKDAPIPEVPDTPQTGGNMPVIPIAAGLLTVVGAVVIIWKKRAANKQCPSKQ